MRQIHLVLLVIGFLAGSMGTRAVAGEVEDLKREIQEMHKESREKDQKLQELEKRLETLEKPARPAKTALPEKGADAALDEAIQALNQKPATAADPSVGLFAQPIGNATLRLIDVSFDILFAAGGSTESDQSLQTLQGGDHDPKKRGFTLGQGELSVGGAVDPYFSGEGHMVFKVDALTGDTEVELEEAFLKTQALPWGFQAKAGYYLTEFGRLNPTHPHAWLWMDQPIINTRIFGADGLRTPGVRLAWLAPVSNYLEFFVGVQNANGETATSFLGNENTSIGGHPFFNREFNSPGELLYSTRLTGSFNPSSTVTVQLGASGLYGPNATGDDGETYIYGGDVVVKWRPQSHFRGWPFITFEGEVMERFYKADDFFAINDPGNPGDDFRVGHEVLRDYGLYAQLLYGFYSRWAAGMRYEYADGDDQTFVNRHLDPYRDQRQRISPLVAFYPSEFSRLRLQYNYDRADHLFDDAHSFWAGIEILFGAHPAHRF